MCDIRHPEDARAVNDEGEVAKREAKRRGEVEFLNQVVRLDVLGRALGHGVLQD
jgi:hypothetical protein